MRARNPVYWPKRGIHNRGFRALMRCVGFSADATIQSTESPIFDAPFWSENGVSCPQCGHERNKIGDSVLCYYLCNNFARWLQKIVATCEAMCRRMCSWMCWFFGGCGYYLCNNFARWLQKIVATRALNPRFWMPIFGQRTGFRARMNEIKSGIPCSGSNMCWVFWDATIFCNKLLLTTLQDDYKR
jgi:hypothetical protein